MKLVIAEKPSVARSIAAVIGATDRQDGYFPCSSASGPALHLDKESPQDNGGAA